MRAGASGRSPNQAAKRPRLIAWRRWRRSQAVIARTAQVEGADRYVRTVVRGGGQVAIEDRAPWRGAAPGPLCIDPGTARRWPAAWSDGSGKQLGEVRVHLRNELGIGPEQRQVTINAVNWPELASKNELLLGLAIRWWEEHVVAHRASRMSSPSRGPTPLSGRHLCAG